MSQISYLFKKEIEKGKEAFVISDNVQLITYGVTFLITDYDWKFHEASLIDIKFDKKSFILFQKACILASEEVGIKGIKLLTALDIVLEAKGHFTTINENLKN